MKLMKYSIHNWLILIRGMLKLKSTLVVLLDSRLSLMLLPQALTSINTALQLLMSAASILETVRSLYNALANCS